MQNQFALILFFFFFNYCLIPQMLREHVAAYVEIHDEEGDPAALARHLREIDNLLDEFGGLYSGTRILCFSRDAKIILGLQSWAFCCMGLTINKMAEKVASFKTGGALWFTDLTTADTSFIFPLLTGLTFWIAVECDAIAGFEGLMLPKHWTRMWIIPMFVMGIFFSKVKF
ncbi:PREDICTED: mitochondrial inner membrane protein OXA1-like isoform X1 [Camelina sativa]|uniref:Mitochondrial inner membrane protein OXA1-like isoform X1 n=2 Tax=Camelina sativa TaxID=90675 RepID=A0ABM1QG43_CAMSA|nr:PREDICTED: mitochondrial inner membrane protein OXA1-like isoform X1 [Camelina sativa]